MNEIAKILKKTGYKTVPIINGRGLLAYLSMGGDLYNPETETYAFGYNEAGSIAVYSLDKEEVVRMIEYQKVYDDYWGAYLGPGGEIYDDPSYENYDPNCTNNAEWCNENFKGVWYSVGSYPEEVLK